VKFKEEKVFNIDIYTQNNGTVNVKTFCRCKQVKIHFFGCIFVKVNFDCGHVVFIFNGRKCKCKIKVNVKEQVIFKKKILKNIHHTVFYTSLLLCKCRDILLLDNH